jgi:hypothetical protein
MVDLSQAQARATAQRRATANRDRALPRVNTQAEQLVVSASMRTARRGDGGAEELMRIFAGSERALQSFADYTDTKFRAEEQGNAAQGATDALFGKQDQELMERSRAYREAVSVGETERAWNESEVELRGVIDEALNDPKNPADLDDIRSLIDGHFKSLAFGPDGQLKDFGSVSAKKLMGEKMAAARTRYLVNAEEIITKQVQARAVDTSAYNLNDRLLRGDALDFEHTFTTVPAGTDLNAAKAAFITTTTSYARAVADQFGAYAEDPKGNPKVDPNRALSVLDQLLASKRADGTPSLNPQEREEVQAERRKVAKDIDTATDRAQRAEREGHSDAFMDRLMRVPGSGSYPSTAEIQRARASGKLEAEGARTLLNWIESDVREAEADRRARERSAGASISGYPPSGSSIMAMVYEGRMSPQAAKGEIIRRAGLGEYGAGNDRRKAVSSMLSEISNLDAVHKGGFATATSAFQSEVISMRRDIRRLPAPQRRKAEKWIKTVEDAGVAAIGAQMHKAGADGQRVGEAVSRSIARDFLSAFPDLAQ